MLQAQIPPRPSHQFEKSDRFPAMNALAEAAL